MNALLPRLFRHRPLLMRVPCVAVLLLSLQQPLAARDPDNCLLCHQLRGLSRFDAEQQRLHLFYVNPRYHHEQLGPHARLACTDCHNRHEVGVIPHLETTPVDCARTCHLESSVGLERRFSHERIAQMLAGSVHPPEALHELEFTDGPLLESGQSACLYCHDEPVFRDPIGAIPVMADLGSRTFDRCDVCHVDQNSRDVQYALRHIASRLQPANQPLELTQRCAVCHSDPQVLADTGMDNEIASFLRSFHGKAALLHNEGAADCISCHASTHSNPHEMLAEEDPRSAVNPVNVGDTCRTTRCHPGADPQFAAAAVHLDLPTERGTLEFTVAFAFIVLTVLTFGPSMLIVVLELFGMILGRHHHSTHRNRELAELALASPAGRRRLTRFTVHQRVQHWMLVVLFALLAITGFPMKFADQPWAAATVGALGGLNVTRLVHHWAGVGLVVGFAYHLLYVITTILKRRRAARAANQSLSMREAVTTLPMWVGPADMLKMGQLLGYLLHLRREPPTFHRFSVKEKFEYIGVFWGSTLLGITGAMLWGEQIFSHIFGGRLFNIALIAHTYEAFLAIIHVGILHIVNVMLSPNVFPLSMATITGRTPVSELAESHSEQVEEVARDLNLAQEGTGHA